MSKIFEGGLAIQKQKEGSCFAHAVARCIYRMCKDYNIVENTPEPGSDFNKVIANSQLEAYYTIFFIIVYVHYIVHLPLVWALNKEVYFTEKQRKNIADSDYEYFTRTAFNIDNINISKKYSSLQERNEYLNTKIKKYNTLMNNLRNKLGNGKKIHLILDKPLEEYEKNVKYGLLRIGTHAVSFHKIEKLDNCKIKIEYKDTKDVENKSVIVDSIDVFNISLSEFKKCQKHRIENILKVMEKYYDFKAVKQFSYDLYDAAYHTNEQNDNKDVDFVYNAYAMFLKNIIDFKEIDMKLLKELYNDKQIEIEQTNSMPAIKADMIEIILKNLSHCEYLSFIDEKFPNLRKNVTNTTINIAEIKNRGIQRLLFVAVTRLNKLNKHNIKIEDYDSYKIIRQFLEYSNSGNGKVYVKKENNKTTLENINVLEEQTKTKRELYDSLVNNTKLQDQNKENNEPDNYTSLIDFLNSFTYVEETIADIDVRYLDDGDKEKFKTHLGSIYDTEESDDDIRNLIKGENGNEIKIMSHTVKSIHIYNSLKQIQSHLWNFIEEDRYITINKNMLYNLIYSPYRNESLLAAKIIDKETMQHAFNFAQNELDEKKGSGSAKIFSNYFFEKLFDHIYIPTGELELNINFDFKYEINRLDNKVWKTTEYWYIKLPNNTTALNNTKHSLTKTKRLRNSRMTQKNQQKSFWVCFYNKFALQDFVKNYKVDLNQYNSMEQFVKSLNPEVLWTQKIGIKNEVIEFANQQRLIPIFKRYASATGPFNQYNTTQFTEDKHIEILINKIIYPMADVVYWQNESKNKSSIYLNNVLSSLGYISPAYNLSTVEDKKIIDNIISCIVEKLKNKSDIKIIMDGDNVTFYGLFEYQNVIRPKINNIIGYFEQNTTYTIFFNKLCLKSFIRDKMLTRRFRKFNVNKNGTIKKEKEDILTKHFIKLIKTSIEQEKKRFNPKKKTTSRK